MQLSSQVATVSSFHSVDSGATESAANRLQVMSAAKDQIGGEFDLIQAPVIADFRGPDHGAIALGELVQPPMQLLHGPIVGHPLSALELSDLRGRCGRAGRARHFPASDGGLGCDAHSDKSASGKGTIWGRARSTTPGSGSTKEK